jgi:hypothetical protein
MPQSEPDELKAIWHKETTNPEKEDYMQMLKFAQEKRNTMQEFLKRTYLWSYVLLVFVPIMLAGNLRIHVPAIQAGNLVLAVFLIVSALATWMFQRLDSKALRLDLSVREYRVRMLEVYDRWIWAGKTAKYAGIPFTLGLSLIFYPMLRFYHVPLGVTVILLVAAFFVIECSFWFSADVRFVKDLKRRRDEMQGALDDLE